MGDSTAAVAVQALDGAVPERLAELEAATVVPDGDGAELRAALRGDCHSHSTWSDGGAPIVDMARAAMALGHDYLVLTDHSPRLTVAHGLTRERLEAQLAEIAGLNEELAPFRILTGVEVDILVDGSLDGDDDMLDRLDVVVASVHSKLKMDRTEMTQRMVKAVLDPRVDILGHCTGRKLKGLPDPGPEDIPDSAYVRPQSRFDPEVVFSACEATDTAVEINCRPERRDPPDELLALAVDAGLLDQHRHRRPRPGPAGVAALRLRQGRPPRPRAPTGSSTPGRPTTWWPGPRAEHRSDRRPEHRPLGRALGRRPGSVASLCRRRPTKRKINARRKKANHGRKPNAGRG